MRIATTINIDSASLKKLNYMARLSGKSRTDIITMLLRKAMDSAADNIRCGSQVRYQERKYKGDWHRFHVVFRPDEYEYFLDLRKIFKMSVSFILSISIEKHMNNCMKKNNTDNYQYKNYILAYEIIDGVFCWKLIWGNTQKILGNITQPVYLCV